MAVYGINKEGVEALNQLANDLSNVNNDIADDGKKLKNTVSGLGDALGIYEDQILDVIESVNNVQEKGRESIEQLAGKVRKMATDADAIVSAGLG
ncbi:hypothetical protein E5357_16065 [Hominisplanchenecus murintestinalis]|uniref:Uncharacterized protein n=1 Tax=Hominisplanchenecus murintestinalis TaxID=2941517 RepID=A0AC61QWH2_9FIRM|nr:hypothetical protein [Hominisplanchenecus murintestinalis]TGX96440.1 hypothetical protein E5357_16065 [Hominisplanchenecus murintestinalis]